MSLGGVYKMSKEQQINRQNEYIKNNYDRITLTVPKGKGADYRMLAAKQGLKLNTVINQLLSDWEEKQIKDR